MNILKRTQIYKDGMLFVDKELLKRSSRGQTSAKVVCNPAWLHRGMTNMLAGKKGTPKHPSAETPEEQLQHLSDHFLRLQYSIGNRWCEDIQAIYTMLVAERIHVIDLCSGAGTGTLAFVDLLDRIRTSFKNKGFPSMPVCITSELHDNNKKNQKYSRKLTGYLRKELKMARLSVSLKKSDLLMEKDWERIKTNSLMPTVIIMSAATSSLERNGVTSQLLARRVRNVISGAGYGSLLVISEPKDKFKTARNQYVAQMTTQITDDTNVLRTHQINIQRLNSRRMHDRVTFFSALSSVSKTGCSLIKRVPFQRLLQAWKKAQWESFRSPIINVAEMRAFGGSIQCLEYNLAKLYSRLVSDGFWKKGFYKFKVPKSIMKHRKMAHYFLAERTMANFLLGKLVDSRRFKNMGENVTSYGNVINYIRVARKTVYNWNSQYVFEYFVNQFRLKNNNLLQCLVRMKKSRKRMIIYNTDVLRYFDCIPVDELLDMISKTHKLDKKLFFELKTYLSSYEKKTGIAQGPSISAYLGNLYLYLKLDSKLKGAWRKRYFRYVDDITFVARNSVELKEFKVFLKRHIKPLRLNESKEKETTRIETIADISRNMNLTSKHNKMYRVVSGLLNVPDNYSSLFGKERNLVMYMNALRALGVNLHLYSLKRYYALGRRTTRERSIRFPAVSLLKKTQLWTTSFKEQNPKVMLELSEIKREITSRIAEVVGRNKREVVRDKYLQRQLRFYLFRSGMFYLRRLDLTITQELEYSLYRIVNWFCDIYSKQYRKFTFKGLLCKICSVYWRNFGIGFVVSCYVNRMRRLGYRFCWFEKILVYLCGRLSRFEYGVKLEDNPFAVFSVTHPLSPDPKEKTDIFQIEIPDEGGIS